jgi:hypothetical protein
MIDPGAVTLGLPLAPTNVAMRLTFGLRGFFGYQVVASGELYWFENFGAADQIEREMLDAVPDAVWRQRLRERHREDHAPIPAIIEATEEAIGRWPIYDLSKLPTWHKGPIGLIGDAAYAISPHAGQGASLAFEDAIVLAMCLRDVNEVEQALTCPRRYAGSGSSGSSPGRGESATRSCRATHRPAAFATRCCRTFSGRESGAPSRPTPIGSIGASGLPTEAGASANRPPTRRLRWLTGASVSAAAGLPATIGPCGGADPPGIFGLHRRHRGRQRAAVAALRLLGRVGAARRLARAGGNWGGGGRRWRGRPGSRLATTPRPERGIDRPTIGRDANRGEAAV